MTLRHRSVAARIVALPALALALLALAGCGGGGSSATAAVGGSTTPTAAPSAGTSGRPGSSAFTAYRDCLAKHGVAVPTGRPGVGSGIPTGEPGGPGSGAPRPSFSESPQMRAAQQACASLRPSGGFGGGFGSGNSAALAAFRSCMSDHGVTLPSTGPGSGIRSLNTADPTTAAALQICRALLPTAGPSGVPGGAPGGAGSSPAPTPST